ncbi:MAG TPA: trehalose-6-phosphate synthase [Acidobacteriota bacterium]|nr:trehalose-6-phosphate synthase [Acidobacteriota bacterium]
MTGGRLLVVSNRLPIAIYKDGDEWKVKASPGGLVTALAPIMRRNRGVWVGWPGCPPEAPAAELLEAYSRTHDYDLKQVVISEEENARYYRGFSNKSLWPLFHDLLGQFSFDTDNWQTYVQVNRRFAETVLANIGEDALIWIHDYQLLLAGHFLRELGVRQKLSFFLHIPFPSVDLFRRLPWKQELLQSMLDYDHLGFQTARDRRNFIQCLKWHVPEAQRGAYKRQSVIRYNQREIILGHYPISIDFDEFSEGAKDGAVADAAWYLHENFPEQTLVLGLDRLDYTKGIPERFLAFEKMLQKYPEVHGKITLLQIVVPSRPNVSEYQQLKGDLDALAGRINARFSRQGWAPIHYEFRELDRTQLLGHYRACEIAFITPLRDGMNLVAKEYCAASIDNQGVLVLSEFAGAADQLGRGALLVNPYDLEGTADAVYSAYIMQAEERQRRMRLLRSEIRRNNVARWVEWFLGADRPAAKEPSQFLHTTE